VPVLSIPAGAGVVRVEVALQEGDVFPAYREKSPVKPEHPSLPWIDWRPRPRLQIHAAPWRLSSQPIVSRTARISSPYTAFVPQTPFAWSRTASV
jgi:hypothetical protein